MSPSTAARRRPSLVNKVREIEHDPKHHLVGPFIDGAQNGKATPPLSNGHRKARAIPEHLHLPPRQGFVRDVISMRWMRVPSSSIKGVILPVVLWVLWNKLSLDRSNPFESLLFISHRVPESSDSDPRFQKGYGDLLFIAYYVVVFCFIRQFTTIHIFHRFARWWGIHSISKIDRFGEQGYAALYWGTMSVWGLRIMKTLPTWYYNTENFWIGYPHWDMPANLKQYYLTQIAFWLQQFLVMVLGLERPRSDFTELFLHHLVTLWLACGSYVLNHTPYGNAVFVSMDLPDTLFAFSKLLNYMELSIKNVTFAIFVVAWTYFRHYLNILMIISTWTEFKLIPESAQKWVPSAGLWMPWWVQYQILAPMVLLQLVNLFWYYLIWRVAFKAIFSADLDDDRSDHEGDEGDEVKEE